MTHPDNVAVGLLGLAMFAVGGLTIIALTLLAAHYSYRFLPLRRSRTLFWIGTIIGVVFALAVLQVAAKAMHALAVIASFGWDAYADGLRVINKHGQLSDGRFLNIFWAAASGAGTVLLMLLAVSPVTVWYLHFHPRRKDGRQLTGVVRLDGRPLPRARVTFYLADGTKLRGYIALKTNEAGRYEFHDVPLKRFRVTVTGDESIPLEYRDHNRTPLELVGDRLEPVEYDLELKTGIF